MPNSVLAYSDSNELAAELSSASRALASSLGAGNGSALVVLDGEVPPKGGKSILVKASRPLAGQVELIVDALRATAEKMTPQVLLIGATRAGRQVAAALSVRMGWPILSDVRDLRVEDGRVTGSRAAFAGKIVATVSAPAPCIATVPQGAYEAQPGSPIEPETIEMADTPPARVRLLETKPKQKSEVDLQSASIIVSAGRGFRTKEDLALAESLATAIGGVLGASRPLSSDLGWVGEERHIGLTGVYVRPALYIAIGISGQLQHIAGIKGSKIIVAINKDRQAPIFQVADYGIVGDLYQVVPALTEAVRVLKGSSPNRSA